MIVFHGGFSKSQVNKLKNNNYVIYRKGSIDNFRINWCNTFKYYNIEKYDKKQELFQNIIEQNFLNQWIHCYKYLYNAIDFCERPNNYIVVFNIENIEQYIGVGKYKYEGYKIEYRIPRKVITNDNIIDVIKYDINYLHQLKEKYSEQYQEIKEHEEALKILKKNKQKCNYI